MDERTEQGRRFLMGYRDDDTTEFVSDQEKKLPQPPLCKAPMGGERTVLPRDFSALPEGGGLYDLLTRRRSARIYTEGELGLLQLSFLLWATQGVRAMRGRAYATLRTVPSGGARHAFETYLLLRHVEGLRPGAYHYSADGACARVPASRRAARRMLFPTRSAARAGQQRPA